MLRFFASLKLAITLIVTLGVVLATATVLETTSGREYVQWYIYHARWFATLLALLGVNILSATLIRWPWKRKLGFLTTHIGLLVLLLGALQTFIDAGSLPRPLRAVFSRAFPGAIDGQLRLKEGTQLNRIRLVDRNQIKVGWIGHSGQEAPPTVGFSFQPGPVDWAEGKTLFLGESGDARFRIVKFYRCAQVQEGWAADESKQAGPVLNLVIIAPDDRQVASDWLTSDSFAGATPVGNTACQIHRAAVASMRDDFLNPPNKDSDPQGVLSVHYDGKMIRLPVSKNLGKRVAIGESHIELEIVKYFANARPSGSGQFISGGDSPDNPLLELRIHLPDGKPPLRQITAAKMPELNLDFSHDRPCPLKFWYHHPGVAAQAEVEFLQMPDGKLICRTGSAGKYLSLGTVDEGDRVPIANGYKVKLANYLPWGRQDVWFKSLQGQPEDYEAAVQVEVEMQDEKHEAWTQRAWLWRGVKDGPNDYSAQTISTPKGLLTIAFDYEEHLLDFDVKLLKFTQGSNPGGMGEASSYSSRVELIDPHATPSEKQIDKALPPGEADIYMNHPLNYAHFVFSQSSFDRTDDGKYTSTIGVANDPGSLLKYVGSVLICVGVFWMFYAKEFTKKFA